MLILLPPSETKRDGGHHPPLQLDALAFPELGAARRRALAALAVVSRSRRASVDALKLGPTQLGEIERNRQIRRSPTTPVLDRYTGVLFDALDAPTLGSAEREFAGQAVAVHSALFGLVMAMDPIPAYRLSHDSRPAGLSLMKHWGPVIAPIITARTDLVLDFRSAGYVALGPGSAPRQYYLRVVTREREGERALNHFNKHAKGVLTRALLRHGENFREPDQLVAWAEDAGFALRVSRENEITLAV